MTKAFSHFTERLLAFMTQSAACGTPNEVEFGQLALELYELQIAHVAAYGKLVEARGIKPGRLREYREIPALPASAFKDWDLTSLTPEKRTSVFFSSGTSAHRPSRHFHNDESLRVYETSLVLWFERHLFLDGPRRPSLLALVPPPEQAPHSSLVHMFDTLARRIPFRWSAFASNADENGAWALDFESARERLASSMGSNEPILLLGTAFSFVHLLDYLGDQGEQFLLPAGSCAMETGGYKGRSRVLAKSELHGLITERLGIPGSHIVAEYGMSELSSQAYDRRLSLAPSGDSESRLAAFHFPPWARVQIISPETGHPVEEGETGLLRVLDLANVFSVAAVESEDLVVRRGPGFELVGRAAEAEARGCSLMAR